MREQPDRLKLALGAASVWKKNNNEIKDNDPRGLLGTTSAANGDVVRDAIAEPASSLML